MAADLKIRRARVIDGTAGPDYYADVTVDKGVITAIDTDGSVADAHRVIDAEGRVLSPGFIDMHAHSDLQILANPDHTAKVSQGVTLEVLGQDGLSFAPCTPDARAILRDQIAGWNGSPDIDTDFDTVGSYLDVLDGSIACHAAYLVPQGTLRLMVVGTDNVAATDEQIARMSNLLDQGMREGAVGMSSGLTYPPGMFANTAELTRLCRTVAAYDGYYSPDDNVWLGAREDMFYLAAATIHIGHKPR